MRVVNHRKGLITNPTGINGRIERVTECPWGHPYSGANLRTEKRKGKEVLVCKHCNRMKQRARRMGVSLAAAYALFPEWLDLDTPALPRGIPWDPRG